MKIHSILLVALAFNLMLGTIPASNAVLWDLIILAEPSKPSYEANEKPIISGKIVNHAYKPLPGVEVKIRFGSESVFTKTDYKGLFYYEFDEKTRTPGKYVVNIVATDPHNGKIGLASTTLEIKGNVIDILSAQESKIEFSEDIDFEKDPIAAILYKHQQEKAAEFEDREKKIEELKQYQKFLGEKRMLADKKLHEIMDLQDYEKSNYVNTWHYEKFASNVDLSVKDIILEQLNYTNKIWSEAQLEMNKILENGGTWEEARIAYFENAKISRQIMEELTLQNNMTEISFTNETRNNQTNNSEN